MDDITLSAEEAKIGNVINYKNGINLRITEIREDGTAAYEMDADPALITFIQILAKIEGTPLALMQLLHAILHLIQKNPNILGKMIEEQLWQHLNWQCTLVALRSQTGPFNEATFPSAAITFPATEEVVNVERDENGLITQARKIRQPIS